MKYTKISAVTSSSSINISIFIIILTIRLVIKGYNNWPFVELAFQHDTHTNLASWFGYSQIKKNIRILWTMKNKMITQDFFQQQQQQKQQKKITKISDIWGLGWQRICVRFLFLRNLFLSCAYATCGNSAAGSHIFFLDLLCIKKDISCFMCLSSWVVIIY